MQNVILLDMDGVLVDWVGGATMTFPQKTYCRCDVCDRWLQRYHELRTGTHEWRTSRLEDQAHGFDSVRHAHTAATSAGWYVDARTVRCPEHWPGETR